MLLVLQSHWLFIVSFRCCGVRNTLGKCRMALLWWVPSQLWNGGKPCTHYTVNSWFISSRMENFTAETGLMCRKEAPAEHPTFDPKRRFGLAGLGELHFVLWLHMLSLANVNLEEEVPQAVIPLTGNTDKNRTLLSLESNSGSASCILTVRKRGFQVLAMCQVVKHPHSRS